MSTLHYGETMTINAPQLDPRDEDEVVAEVVDDLPAKLSDRNRSSLAVELVEAVGTFYGKLLYYLNQWPQAVEYKVLELLGVTPNPATNATVTLTFTSAADAASPIVVPAGTIVKTGTGDDAVEFATDVDVTVPATGGTADVQATAVEAGAAGNVAPDMLVFLDVPIGGMDGVTNALAASGGQDEETLAAMKVRSAQQTRSQDRIVTDEDAELVATGVSGALRANALGATYFNGVDTFITAAGARSVAIVSTDLNETTDGPLQDNVVAAIKAKDLPGVNVSTHQPNVRLIYITNVSAKLDGTRTESEVRNAILEALRQYFTALDLYDADGVTLIQPGWKWGERMYAYEVISLIDRVPGIDRVASILIDYSDDYGINWQVTPVPLTDLEPGPFGDVTDRWGLFHWGEDYAPPTPFTLTVL